jgi:hypothetical protein
MSVFDPLLSLSPDFRQSYHSSGRSVEAVGHFPLLTCGNTRNPTARGSAS